MTIIAFFCHREPECISLPDWDVIYMKWMKELSPFKKQLHLIVQVFLTWCHESIHKFQISCLGGWGKEGSLDAIIRLEQKPTSLIRLWYSLIKDRHLRIRIVFNMRISADVKSSVIFFNLFKYPFPLKKFLEIIILWKMKCFHLILHILGKCVYVCLLMNTHVYQSIW